MSLRVLCFSGHFALPFVPTPNDPLIPAVKVRQKNAPPKSQTRISAFFGRAPAAPAPPASIAPDSAAPAAAVLRRSPRKKPVLIDVTGETVSPNVSPARTASHPAEVREPKSSPGRVLDLDYSCEPIPSGGVGGEAQEPTKENRMTGIADRIGAVGSGVSDGAGAGLDTSGGVFGAAGDVTDGPRLVQRLTKRPAPTGAGRSPQRKRPTGPAGVAANGSRSSPRKANGLLGLPKKLKDSVETQDSSSNDTDLAQKAPLMTSYRRKSLSATVLPRRSPRKLNGSLLGKPASKRSQDPVLLDLKRALRAGEAAAGLPAAWLSAADEETSVALDKRKMVDVRVPVPPDKVDDCSERPIPVDATENVAGSGATETNGVIPGPEMNSGASAAVAALERPRHRTPEPPETSELLFESMADLFTSPFKEEAAAARSVPCPRAGECSHGAGSRRWFHPFSLFVECLSLFQRFCIFVMVRLSCLLSIVTQLGVSLPCWASVTGSSSF